MSWVIFNTITKVQDFAKKQELRLAEAIATKFDYINFLNSKYFKISINATQIKSDRRYLYCDRFLFQILLKT